MQRSASLPVLRTEELDCEYKDVVDRLLRNLRKRDWRLGLGALVLALGTAFAGLGYWYFAASNHFTVAIGPPDGIEARLVGAFADALVEQKKDIRLKVLPFGDVRQSAEALQQKKSIWPLSGRTCSCLTTV